MCAVFFFAFGVPHATHAQLAPGPYEILPFDDGFIIEAFKDLDPNSGMMADWTGWSGSDAGFFLISPHPYDGHIGTDFSVQTGTPLHAAAAGTVAGIETKYGRDTFDYTYGNYVRIAVDTPSPAGESLELTFCHMLSLSVSLGQHVNVGDLVGYSDNTGQSDSEHVHFMTEIPDVNNRVTNTCPFYWAHFKHPIMFNPTGTLQVGRVVKITAASTAIRTDRFDSSPQITTAWQNQLYFSSYPKRGYYQVFIPNNPSYRSGWIRATDAEEVFTGTVIQALPDKVTYTQLGQLAARHPIRSAPNDTATQIGQILFGGGRFVADSLSNGYYRIPLPGASAAWGWVKPNNRMVVYPQLTNPSLNLDSLPNNDLPIRESFSTLGKSMFGRPKFKRSEVKAFAPASPGGDGKALFLTDEGNHGSGSTESVLVGKPGHRNYYVQCDVYFNFGAPSGKGYERYGIFLRDDGFAGMDTTYEGAGNGYAMLWDTDDGYLRTARLDDGTVTDLQPTPRYITSSGWHRMRIEARENKIRYQLDGQVLFEATDTTFPSGQCGIGYSTHRSDWPLTRGACFDNFVADTLVPAISTEPGSIRVLPDNLFQFTFFGATGCTYEVMSSTNLQTWAVNRRLLLTDTTAVVRDPQTNGSRCFYRVRLAQ